MGSKATQLSRSLVPLTASKSSPLFHSSNFINRQWRATNFLITKLYGKWQINYGIYYVFWFKLMVRNWAPHIDWSCDNEEVDWLPEQPQGSECRFRRDDVTLPLPRHNTGNMCEKSGKPNSSRPGLDFGATLFRANVQRMCFWVRRVFPPTL